MELTSKILEKALTFAIEKHHGQLRKGNGQPYVLHPIAVMLILMKIKRSNHDVLIAIACLLHDVVEDCDVHLDEIAEHFGHSVASLVGELTSDKDKVKEFGKANYLGEKMVKMSSFALRIKLADRLHNLEDIDPLKDVQKVDETQYILNYVKEGRKLTKTHKKLIKLIEKKINGRKRSRIGE